jgi:hypothetical protein
MSIKFGSIVFLFLAIFIAKLSIENLNEAQASDKVSSLPIQSQSVN